MVEILQLLAIPLTAFAAIVRRAESRAVKRLRSAEAFSPETAIELPPVNALGRWQLGRLEKAGALVAAEPDHFYFAEEGYAAFRKARRERALVIVPVLLVVVLFSFFVLAPVEGTTAESVCRGTTANGRLEHGCRMPAGGENYSAYSSLGRFLNRTWVHCAVAAVAEDAYGALVESSPDKRFVYGETGWPSGGRFRPHKTHRNGLSVDFMVPVLDAEGRSVPLPTSALNRFGYDVEFDGKGRYEGLRIDFEALAAHLAALDEAAREHGIGIDRVIFDPQLQPFLHGTESWPAIAGGIRFSTHPAWVRHDEHYHVDFRIPCEPLG
jgi:penicillin-insensitive murein DD-endopeptidase